MSKAAGKRAQAHARRWERHIRAECAELAEAGLAFVAKNWEAPKVRGKHVSIEASKPDFSGYLPGGRHVVFEAKSTLVETRFDLDLLADHQLDHLQRAVDHGALAFVYVLDGLGRKWVLTTEAILGAMIYRSSVPFDISTARLEVRGEWTRRGSAFVWEGEGWLDAMLRIGGPR